MEFDDQILSGVPSVALSSGLGTRLLNFIYRIPCLLPSFVDVFFFFLETF